MKFILGLGRMFGVAPTAMAIVIASFPSIGQPADRAGEFPTLVLVRHADTAALPDRPLSAAGLKRAQDLAAVANPAPGAQFPPEVVQARAEYIKILEPAIRRLSGVVLVVGHDWSVPGLIASLGGPQLPNICPSVFDNLFVLTSAQGEVSLIQAHYGEPTHDDCK
jgi:hypothetical protein